MPSAAEKMQIALELVCQRTAQTLILLAELDQHRLWMECGHATLIEYCVEHLGMDEDEAAERVEVARLALPFPDVIRAVATGHLNMVTARLIAPHLTASNADELIAAVAHRREAEVRAMLREWFPDKDLARRV